MTDRHAILQQWRQILDQALSLHDADLLLEMQEMLEQAMASTAAAATATATPEIEVPYSWHGLIGKCAAILKLEKQASKFAAASAPVLIRGESGTGKEVLAKAIHKLSPRARQPFVSENCAAIPETLLESVLFGHVRGSFTGAVRDHSGHFVAAHKGTLFLDEIGDMPLSMQAKLLRALQEGEVRPVGGTKIRKVDVRVIAATNQGVEEMVAKKTFREDLYYRLNVLALTLPPLRERGDDILLLTSFFLDRAAAAVGRKFTFDDAANQALLKAPWPGNVRQLQNEMQRLAAMQDSGELGIGALSSDITG